MKKITLLLIIVTLLVKVINLIREITFASFYGISSLTDSYILAISIPFILLSFFGTSIKIGFIPKYNEIIKVSTESNAKIFTTKIFYILFFLLLSFSILIRIFSLPIIGILGYGFSDDVKLQGVYLLENISFSLIFIGLSSLLTAYLQVKNIIFISVLSSIPMNFILILSYFYSGNNLNFLSYGYLLGTIVQFSTLLLVSLKHNLTLKISKKTFQVFGGSFLPLLIPTFFSIAVKDINQLIDQMIASGLGPGSISSLNFGSKGLGIIQSIIIVSFSTVFYPKFSNLFSQNKIEELKSNFFESQVLQYIILAPLTLFLILFSEEIIEIIFGRGLFDNNAIVVTSRIQVFYAIGLLFSGVTNLANKIFFSMQNYRIPLYVSFFSVFSNIILNLLSLQFTELGIYGIALSTSISIIIGSMITIILLNKRIKNIFNKDLFFVILKISSSMVLTYFILLFFNEINSGFFHNSILKVISYSTLGLFIYLVILDRFGIPQVNSLKLFIFKKINFFISNL